MRARRWIATPIAAAALIVGLSSGTASAHPSGIDLRIEHACPDTGGVELAFTIANTGRVEQHLRGDFHLFLAAVRSGGLQPMGALFVFPAPGFNIIPPDEQRTFLLPFGTAFPEAEEPGVDMSGHRLLLRAEVFVAGRAQHVTQMFTFRGCPPLT